MNEDECYTQIFKYQETVFIAKMLSVHGVSVYVFVVVVVGRRSVHFLSRARFEEYHHCTVTRGN